MDTNQQVSLTHSHTLFLYYTTVAICKIAPPPKKGHVTHPFAVYSTSVSGNSRIYILYKKKNQYIINSRC